MRPSQPIVVVHGGAGRVEPGRLGECVTGCERAALAAAAKIEEGALAAAVEAVRLLEEDPSFNAGLGSTLNQDGGVELDAAVMTGDLRFGGVAACPPVASAVGLALDVLEDGRHALLAGEGASRFAEETGMSLLDAGALKVPRQVRRWKEGLLHPVPGEPETVGAVALDARGGLAAATSTGGILMKRPGRVGDSPLPGAGTYADEAAGGAASATGQGESIMRALLCFRAVEAVGRGLTPAEAVSEALGYLAERVLGEAGMVLVDGEGRWFAGNNTPMMTWAACRPGEDPVSGH